MSTLPSVTVAGLLRRHRLAAGLSQEELAERAHLSREAISALERGTRRAPRQETIDLLADALGLTSAERALLHATARRLGSAPAAESAHLLPTAREIMLPLIGREQELARLEHHLACEGPPCLLLAGEPGIGKTQLLAEASQRARVQGWTVLEGGCLRRSGQEPYAPLLEALEGALHRSSPARLRTQLDGCAWLVRLLPELADTTLVPVPSWTLPPEQERRLLFAAVRRFLANSAGPAGVVLLLDDLQWAGADALDLLASLLRSPGERTLRVIGAYRSTEVRPSDPLGMLLADLAASLQVTQLQLGPLNRQSAHVLLHRVLGADEGVASAVREQVVARTGGVPFFLVSCAQALRMGVLEEVPWHVAESIRQRIALASPAAREVLGTAAIVGRSVPRWLLLKVARALGQERRSVIEALEVTGQARLLVEAGEEDYQFPHDLIREVVLADLSAARRASLHQQVAEALEQELGEAPVEQLAYHYSRAGKAEQAIRYLERAADRAQARYAHSEAQGYYQQLIERLETLGRRAEAAVARERLGVVLLTATRYEQALEMLEQAVTGYQARADREGMARATAHIGLAHALCGSFVEGIARVQPLLEGAIPETLSALSLAYLYDALAQLFQRSERYSEQLAAAERAGVYAQQAQDTQLLARAKASYGLALAYLDRKDEAIAWLEAALSLRQVSDVQNYAAKAQVSTPQIENPQLLPEMLNLLALQAWADGDWNQSLAHLELARSLLDQATNAWVLAQVLIGLGAVKLFRGQGGGAHDLEEAHRLIEHPFIEQWIVIILSECELVRGDAAAASARLEPLLEEANIFTDYVLIGMGWAALQSDPEKAATLIEQGITLARSTQSQRGLTDGLRIRALLAMQQKQWQAAEQSLEEALQVSRSMPFPYGEAKALYVYGLLHQAKTEPERAHEWLEGALAILNRLGERLYAEQVERALATGAELRT